MKEPTTLSEREKYFRERFGMKRLFSGSRCWRCECDHLLNCVWECCHYNVMTSPNGGCNVGFEEVQS